jgi:hypothetical protein
MMPAAEGPERAAGRRRRRAASRRALTCAAFISGLGVYVSAQQATHIDLEGVLERAGARVTEYLARAQSIMCLEKVSLQKLSYGFSADGPARFVESELRLSWQPSPEDPTPKEARTLRQVLKVNGHAPRKKDYDNCTTPEQQETEEQPLSILLPDQRVEFAFAYDGRGLLDGRDAIIVTFRETAKPTVDVSMSDDNENCISFDIEGGMRGKIWIDAETHDVLRLDRSLTGLIDIPLPRKAQRFGVSSRFTMERWDSSIRFRSVEFNDPSETLVLPVSSSTLQITRGSGTPRLRTTTQYTAYQRFITGARVVPQG